MCRIGLEMALLQYAKEINFEKGKDKFLRLAEGLSEETHAAISP
jgi:hypothetical protein